MSSLSRRSFLLGTGGALALTACGGGSSSGSGGPPPSLGISAIPDQNPELLNRLYPMVAARFGQATGLTVSYKPVTDYTAVVRAFEIGDIHLAWMGGLTGVQARTRVPGSPAIAQRDIDADFHSLFIANRKAGIAPFSDANGLRALAGHTLTFGSETSTSGRLMPQNFLQQGGVAPSALKGAPGFSGSHDATIEAVRTGSFEVGAVSEQVWNKTVKAAKVDLSSVVVLWRSPGFADYHWLARPDMDATFGAGTQQKITNLLLGLDVANPDDKAVLDLFGAKKFIATQNSNYDQIEATAKAQGLLG